MTDISRIIVMERIRKEINKIDELAKDIQQHGLINPVTVMKIPGGELQLIAGLRRLKAVRSLGWIEIAVNVVFPADAEMALRIEISENEQREDFTFSEQVDYGKLLEVIENAKAKERMSLGGKGGIEQEGKDPGPYLDRKQSRDAIGEKIGMSGRQYDRAKYIAENASQEVLEQLDNKERKIRPTYDELRAEARNKQSSISEDVVDEVEPFTSAEPEVSSGNKPMQSDKPARPKTPTKVPDSYFTEQDKEAMRKIQEFAAMSPEEKVTELQRQLKVERARAASAESELARLKELRHNDNLHNNANINNLKMQLKSLNSALEEADARIKELEALHSTCAR